MEPFAKLSPRSKTPASSAVWKSCCTAVHKSADGALGKTLMPFSPPSDSTTSATPSPNYVSTPARRKAHGLLDRAGHRYAYQLIDKGRVALRFILFHQRVCGPLASSLFHRQPTQHQETSSKLEAAYHRVDASVQRLIDSPAA